MNSKLIYLEKYKDAEKTEMDQIRTLGHVSQKTPNTRKLYIYEKAQEDMKNKISLS